MTEQKLPFNAFFIVLLIIVFSIIGIIVRNISIAESIVHGFYITDCDKIVSVVILGLIIFIFLGFLSFAFPLETDSILISSLINSAFYLPTVILPCFYLFSNNELAQSVTLCLSILIWSILIFNKTSESENLIDFISSLWLVSGVFVTLGLVYFDYAKYSISVITSFSNYFDIRYILTALIAVIVLARAISETFSRELPEIIQIKPLKIIIPKSLEDSSIISILYSFVYVPNILMLIIFTISNILWNVLATISVITWRFCVNLIVKVYEYFSAKAFWQRMGFVSIIASLLFISEMLKKLNYSIIDYIKHDYSIFEFHSLNSISLLFGGLFVLTTLIFVILYFLEFELDGITFQLRLKLTYFFLLLMIFCASGWFLFFLRKISILKSYDIPNIGTITVLVSAFTFIIITVFSVISLIKNRL